MRRRDLLFILLLLLAVAGVVVAVFLLVERDREALLAELEAERLAQLEEAAHRFADDLDDLGDDLRFAAELVSRGGPAASHQGELRALIEVVGQYKAIGVFQQDVQPFIVWDRRVTGPVRSSPVRLALGQVAQEALSRPAGTIVASAPVDLAAGGEHRVFATSNDGEAGKVAVGVVVDVAPLLGSFQLIAKQGDTRLLVLGAAGRPTSVSDPVLAARVQSGGPEAPRFAAALERMVLHQRGCELLPPEEAPTLGVGRAPTMVCFLPIQVEGGRSWAAATVASTESLTAPLQRVALRTAMGAAVIVGFLVLLAAYVVVASRRAAALAESQRAATRLAMLHERTQRILDHIPTGVLVLGAQQQVTGLNRAVQLRTPSARPALPLEAAFPLAPAPVTHTLSTLVSRAETSQEPQTLLGEHLALFGEEGQFNVHAVPLAGNDPQTHTLLVLEDISNVRALESQLVRAEKLATIGVLAAGIAHEIGTPLGVIRGRAEYLLGKLGQAHPHASGLRIIAEQIDQVSSTIGQLLDFSRVHPPQAVPTALEPVAAGVSELLRIEADRRGVALRLELAPRLPPLWADPDQLRQVLVNLVLNAFDACERGGQVRVSAARSEQDPRTGSRLELKVADDGCGIPREHQAQVFDPFFTTKKRGQGTGLGLAIVAQLVRNHGGEVQLVEQERPGTTVRLLWPVAPLKPELSDAAVQSPLAGG